MADSADSSGAPAEQIAPDTVTPQPAAILVADWLKGQNPFIVFAAMRAAYDALDPWLLDPDGTPHDRAFAAARTEMLATKPATMDQLNVLAEYALGDNDCIPADERFALLDGFAHLRRFGVVVG